MWYYSAFENDVSINLRYLRSNLKPKVIWTKRWVQWYELTPEEFNILRLLSPEPLHKVCMSKHEALTVSTCVVSEL